MPGTSLGGSGLERPISARVAASQPTPKINLDIQLIVVSDPSGKLDVKDGKKVRAHVMRQSHRKRRAKLANAVEEKGEKDVEQIELQVNTASGSRIVRFGHHGSRDGFRKISPYKAQVMSPLLGSGRCDPFVSLPVADPPKRYHELMDISKSSLFPVHQYCFLVVGNLRKACVGKDSAWQGLTCSYYRPFYITFSEMITVNNLLF